MAGSSNPDVDVEALLKGYPSVDQVDRKVLAGAVIDAMDLVGLVGENRIEHYFDLFERSPRALLIKELADRAGIPFSEAKVRWSNDEDLAAEIGHKAKRAIDSWERCQRCGVHRDEMFRENGRPLEFGKWKFLYRKCRCCDILGKLNQDEEGAPWGMAPRSPGDPLQDGPGLFD